MSCFVANFPRFLNCLQKRKPNFVRYMSSKTLTRKNFFICVYRLWGAFRAISHSENQNPDSVLTVRLQRGYFIAQRVCIHWRVLDWTKWQVQVLVEDSIAAYYSRDSPWRKCPLNKDTAVAGVVRLNNFWWCSRSCQWRDDSFSNYLFLNRPFSKMAAENSNKSKLKTYTSNGKNTFTLVTLQSFSIPGVISAEKT